jgi:hypothetical protein
MRFLGRKWRKIFCGDSKDNGMSCFGRAPPVERSGFLRYAAHKSVSSFGRNDDSSVWEKRTSNGNGVVDGGTFVIPPIAKCAMDGAPGKEKWFAFLHTDEEKRSRFASITYPFDEPERMGDPAEAG